MHLVLLILLISVCNAYKMIKISGKVIGEPSGVPGKISTCLDDCVASPTCFLVYSNSDGECISLTVGSAYQVNLTKDGSFVGFKVDTVTTCPATYRSMKFFVTMPDGFIYKWTTNYATWTFDGCRDTWSIFNRDDGSTVCIKVFPQRSISFADSNAECVNMNTKLTGMATVSESMWVQTQVASIPNYVRTGVWIGGVRSCEPGEECSVFKWTDNYTTGYAALVSPNAELSFGASSDPEVQNCLTVSRMTDIPMSSVDDVNCDSSVDFITGYVCGYKVGTF